MIRHALLPVACLLVLAWTPPPAAAQEVRRCVDARGVAVYTDRPCNTVDALPREAPPDPAAGTSIEEGFAVRGCARKPEQLLEGVRGALEARDVNRLANWYHWTGTGSGAARYLMDDLEAIAERPLVTVELIYPEPTAEPGAEPGASFTSPEPMASTESTGEVNLTPPTDAPDAPIPDHLRVQQTASAADITSVETRFRLVENAGCWWIER